MSDFRKSCRLTADVQCEKFFRFSFSGKKSLCLSVSNKKFLRLSVSDKRFFPSVVLDTGVGFGLLSAVDKNSVLARNLTGWRSVGSTRCRCTD